MYTLYSYFRSSAAYRVRIALALKGIDYQIQPVHLLNEGGQHRLEDYTQLNPQQLVPCLKDHKTSEVFSQSLAILEYLELAHPTPALLPNDLSLKTKIRSMMQFIACDIHPLNNLRVIQYLKGPLQQSQDQAMQWYFHWLEKGFSALERTIETLQSDRQYCVGNAPSLADVCLIPQVFNAKRFEFDMTDFPRIEAIYQHCTALEPFIQAHPQTQVDFETA